jgi:dTDP-4-dehydrorhamnose 3,5-epimerase-like enzyme
LINDIKKLQIQYIPDGRGDMFILEKDENLSFDFVRTYFIYGDPGIERGNHSHKKCFQFHIAIKGSIEFLCKDGVNEKRFILSDPKEGLLIPPGIWSSQVYKEKNTILGVWCDRPYEEEDYIRNWESFLESKEKN